MGSVLNCCRVSHEGEINPFHHASNICILHLVSSSHPISLDNPVHQEEEKQIREVHEEHFDRPLSPLKDITKLHSKNLSAYRSQNIKPTYEIVDTGLEDHGKSKEITKDINDKILDLKTKMITANTDLFDALLQKSQLLNKHNFP